VSLMMHLFVSLFISLCFFGGGIVEAQANARAATAASALQGWYNSQTGLWSTTGWWNSGNALTALAHFTARTNNDTYLNDIRNTHTRITNYLNDYYDDEGWWCLAWIEVYKLTKEATYLATAETIFKDISGGWDTKCNGGVWWSKAKNYKNAIPNELFLSAAAGLYLITKNQAYLDWAKNEWTWFSASGMINSQHLVNDGLTNACKSNNQTTWTYNQGVILGGLVDLYHATSDQQLLVVAEQIAGAAISHLARNGILHEPCEPSCGNDAPQFKGIFMRNLGYLYQATHNQTYSTFISRNADSIWASDRNARNQLGLVWAGPFDSADASRQSSAMDAINSALLF